MKLASAIDLAFDTHPEVPPLGMGGRDRPAQRPLLTEAAVPFDLPCAPRPPTRDLDAVPPQLSAIEAAIPQAETKLTKVGGPPPSVIRRGEEDQRRRCLRVLRSVIWRWCRATWIRASRREVYAAVDPVATELFGDDYWHAPPRTSPRTASLLAIIAPVLTLIVLVVPAAVAPRVIVRIRRWRRRRAAAT